MFPDIQSNLVYKAIAFSCFGSKRISCGMESTEALICHTGQIYICYGGIVGKTQNHLAHRFMQNGWVCQFKNRSLIFFNQGSSYLIGILSRKMEVIEFTGICDIVTVRSAAVNEDNISRMSAVGVIFVF